MAEFKETGNCRYLIAMGCLVQRYKKDLEKSIPEVDLYLKIDEYDKIWEKIEDLLKRDIVEKAKNKTSKKNTKKQTKVKEMQKKVEDKSKYYDLQ